LTFSLGGCDGCLNLNDRDNAGLENVVLLLEFLHEDSFPLNGKEMSKADFFALAGIAAVEFSVAQNNKACNAGDSIPDCHMNMV